MPFIATNEILTKKILAALLVVLTLLSAAPSANEKQISVYSPVAIYALPVLERAGHEYVGLLELLEPLGRVSSEANGRSLKLRYNAIDAEFVAGKTRAMIHGRAFDFSAPFLIENSRGLVPLASLGMLLPRFLGTQVNWHEGGRRLFIGGVGIQISFQLDPTNPARLEVNFSAPVDPTISTEPGRLRMVFKRDAVVSPGSQSISFDNKIIQQASYSEDNGDAELDIAANEPLMATFGNDRRTITVSAVAPATVTNGSPAAPNGGGQQPSSPSQPAANSPGGGNNSVAHRMIAVVDAAHGGDERGAALTDTLAEKDVTLGFARLLRHELEYSRLRGSHAARQRHDFDYRPTRCGGQYRTRCHLHQPARCFARERGSCLYRFASGGRSEQRSLSSLECGASAGFAHQQNGGGGDRHQPARQRFSGARILGVLATAE